MTPLCTDSLDRPTMAKGGLSGQIFRVLGVSVRELLFEVAVLGDAVRPVADDFTSVLVAPEPTVEEVAAFEQATNLTLARLGAAPSRARRQRHWRRSGSGSGGTRGAADQCRQGRRRQQVLLPGALELVDWLAQELEANAFFR